MHATQCELLVCKSSTLKLTGQNSLKFDLFTIFNLEVILLEVCPIVSRNSPDDDTMLCEITASCQFDKFYSLHTIMSCGILLTRQVLFVSLI